MINADQQNLLHSTESDNHSHGANLNVRYSSNQAKFQLKKNMLLLLISLLIATCLTFYIYLNYVAINGSGSSSLSNTSDQSDSPDRYKPLSRRKPMLDHESIFSESGPSLLRLSDIMAHCIAALQIGGRKVVDLSLKNNARLSHVGSKGKTREGVDDVVTGADMQSHEVILKTIKDSYRRLRVVSEEDTTSAFENLKVEDDILPIDRKEFASMLGEYLHQIEGDKSNNWPLIAQHETLVWIDPLDATKEYSENLTDYVTLMACIVHKSIPIAGIIHKPFENKTYWSLKDTARHLTVHSPDLVKVWTQTEVKKKMDSDGEFKVTVSRSHAGNVESQLRTMFGQSISIIPAGGSGYKTLELISANVDAYIHVTHIKKWDICAPQAILSSLPGGKMSDLNGGQISFSDPNDKVVKNGLIASFKQETQDSLVSLFASYKLNN